MAQKLWQVKLKQLMLTVQDQPGATRGSSKASDFVERLLECAETVPPSTSYSFFFSDRDMVEKLATIALNAAEDESVRCTMIELLQLWAPSLAADDCFHFSGPHLQRRLRRKCKRRQSQICRHEDVDAELRGSVKFFKEVQNVVIPVKRPVDIQSNKVVKFQLTPSLVGPTRLTCRAVQAGKPVLVVGPSGCGKTALVDWLAAQTGATAPPDYIKIQLGEQMDGKALFWSYHCTEVPGEFVWKPGPLLQIMKTGGWVLLEDVDKAPAELAPYVCQLLESGRVSVPGRGEVQPASGFQLFATVRLTESQSSMNEMARSGNRIFRLPWIRVHLMPYSRDDLIEIVNERFPVLKKISSRLVDTLLKLTSETDIYSGSHFCSRSLMTWCARISKRLQADGVATVGSIDAEATLTEALDVFVACLPTPAERAKAADILASQLNISGNQVEFLIGKRKLAIDSNEKYFTIGRARLPRIANKFLPLPRNFALTQPTSLLMERVGVCVANREPVLLVSETGCGKTTAVQTLALCLGQQLTVVNLSQHSDASDLLGSFKPADISTFVEPLKARHRELFCKTFPVKKNLKFLAHVDVTFRAKKWPELVQLLTHTTARGLDTGQFAPEWKALAQRLDKLGSVINAGMPMAFAFVEGPIIRCIREGSWVLLDEINLASPETLNTLCCLLDSSDSLVFSEKGDLEPLKIHDNFRIFACMNPATDVGKRNIPAGLRSRFTEVYVEELSRKEDLLVLCNAYFRSLTVPTALTERVVDLYIHLRDQTHRLASDEWGHSPHFSLRTLCRALVDAQHNRYGNVQRSLYESLCMSFLSQLDRGSYAKVLAWIREYVIGKRPERIKAFLAQPVAQPVKPGQYKQVEGYWIPCGPLDSITDERYVITPTVRKNITDIARICSAGGHPVLLQGETSAGKTSLIAYLAKLTGYTCVRINNHEHTDLQEYIGSYCSDASGTLVFHEGPLVKAMRKGSWIILDELNLAPSDVLEALNRLLDDNRELLIPETQEVVKAHSHFMLFATQNPPGLYGGRKALSRAFRGRFIELQFAEFPHTELEVILQLRCCLPQSYAKKMVAVLHELQMHRSASGVFAGKETYMTLRDLFRWGERYRSARDQDTYFFDWDQYLLDQGYLLLSGRCRRPDDEKVTIDVLEKVFKRKVNPDEIFGPHSSYSVFDFSSTVDGFEHIVWTRNLRRLAVLLSQAIAYQEPIVFVGETGCGKTTLCQMIATVRRRTLSTINCHAMSEAADFLGRLRPTPPDLASEGKLFEWQDGPLTLAMRLGGYLMVDEISLADDSVLERMNSVLEPERSLLLSEKGTSNESGDATVQAHEDFRLMATMNPGGDYGKKELSKALRNRFTEVWCHADYPVDDIVAIVEHNVAHGASLGNQQDGSSGFGRAMVEFMQFLAGFDIRLTLTIRDILSWISFINRVTDPANQLSVVETAISNERSTKGKSSNQGSAMDTAPANEHSAEDKSANQGSAMDTGAANQLAVMDPGLAYVHGGCMVVIDGLQCNHAVMNTDADLERRCLQFLCSQVYRCGGTAVNTDTLSLSFRQPEQLVTRDDVLFMDPFCLSKGPKRFTAPIYNWTVGSCRTNLMRIMRALAGSAKPILLEGPPGVGKTTMVTALAQLAGYDLVRINLSEQTDLGDLFGMDVPIKLPNGKQGFAWFDGPLLQALKSSKWVLLDEMNLASQSVLEGLNACFDHRGEVFIPELGQSFRVDASQTRFFACQNPFAHGGNRKGLPKSFVNRFAVVYVQPPSSEDQTEILTALYPSLALKDSELPSKMVSFCSQLTHAVCHERLWGHLGSPWELNLRDMMKWVELMQKNKSDDPAQLADVLFSLRFRTHEDRNQVKKVFESVFDKPMPSHHLTFTCTQTAVQLGDCILPRRHSATNINISMDSDWAKEAKGDPDWSKNVKVGSDSTKNAHVDSDSSRNPSIDSDWSKNVKVGSDWLSNCASEMLILPCHMEAFRALGHCLNMGWLAILIGSSGVGKSCIIDSLAALTGNKVRRLYVTSETDTNDFLGGYEQVTDEYYLGNFKNELVDVVTAEVLHEIVSLVDNLSTVAQDVNKKRLRKLLELKDQLTKCPVSSGSLTKLSKRLSSLIARPLPPCPKPSEPPNGTRFEWIDSCLVEALTSGHWFVVEDVNLCSPAVLDRLNGLLEPNGVLALNERGLVDGRILHVKPHPNFRIMFTMDPLNGSLSRAMRNRAVEICLTEKDRWTNVDDLVAEVLAANGCCRNNALAIISDSNTDRSSASLLQSAFVHSYRPCTDALPQGESGSAAAEMDTDEKSIIIKRLFLPQVTDVERTSHWSRDFNIVSYMQHLLQTSRMDDARRLLSLFSTRVTTGLAPSLAETLHGLFSEHEGSLAPILKWIIDEGGSLGAEDGLVNDSNTIRVGETVLDVNWFASDLRWNPEMFHLWKTQNKDSEIQMYRLQKNRVILYLMMKMIAIRHEQARSCKDSVFYRYILWKQGLAQSNPDDEIDANLIHICQLIMQMLRNPSAVFDPCAHDHLSFDPDTLIRLAVESSNLESLLVCLKKSTTSSRNRKEYLLLLWFNVAKVFFGNSEVFDKNVQKKFEQIQTMIGFDQEACLNYLQNLKRFDGSKAFAGERSFLAADAAISISRKYNELMTNCDADQRHRVFSCLGECSDFRRQFWNSFSTSWKDGGTFDVENQAEKLTQLGSKIQNFGQPDDDIPVSIMLPSSHNPDVHIACLNQVLSVLLTVDIFVDNPVAHFSTESDSIDVQNNAVNCILDKTIWTNLSPWIEMRIITIDSVLNRAFILTAFLCQKMCPGLPIGDRLARNADLLTSKNLFSIACHDALTSTVTACEVSGSLDSKKQLLTTIWRLGHVTSASKRAMTEMLHNLLEVIERRFDVPSSDPGLQNRLKLAGQVLMNTFAPPKSIIDPILRSQLKKMHLQENLDEIECELNAYTEEHYALTGMTLLIDQRAHPYLGALLNKRHELRQRLDRLKDAIGYRPEITQFESLRLAMLRFLEMTSSLSESQRGRQTWLKSADTFCDMVTEKYPAYVDIYQPFVLGVNLTRLSILLSHKKPPKADEGSEPSEFTDQKLTTRHDAGRMISMCLQYLDSPHMDTLRKQKLITVLCRLAHDCPGLPDESRVMLVSAVYALWRRQQDAKAEASTSTYSYKPKQPLSEEEQEEEELKEMFPDFSNEFLEQEKSDENLDMEDDNDISQPEKTYVVPDQIFGEWIQMLLNKKPGKTEDFEAFEHHLLDILQILWPENLFELLNDDEHLAPCVYKLHKSINDSEVQCPSVYEPSVHHLRRLWPLVQKLYNRTFEIRQEFPESSYLHAVLEACVKIAKLPATAPLMKVLCGVEYLLETCESWASVAARHVSLHDQTEPLMALVVEWRRREISGWDSLLETASRRTQDASLPLCLEFWAVAQAFSIGSVSRPELIKAMSQLVESCSVGQLAYVLHFAQFTLDHNRPDSLVDWQYLTNLLAYYRLSLPAVLKTIMDGKLPFANQLKDVINILRYTEGSFHSLKRAVDKTHKQLCRLTRRFKVFLSQPVSSHFDRLPEIVLPLKTDPAPQITFGIPTEKLPETAAHDLDTGYSFIDDIDRFLTRVSEICDNLSKMTDFENITTTLSEADGDILELLTEMGKHVDYGDGADEEKEKLFRKTMNYRRKAFENLLKSLKSMGISYRKGMDVDKDGMSEKLMSCPMSENQENDPYFISVAFRKAVLDAGNAQHAQVGPKTAGVMRGILENLATRLLNCRRKSGKFSDEVNQWSRLSGACDSFVMDLPDTVDYQSVRQSIFESADLIRIMTDVACAEFSVIRCSENLSNEESIMDENPNFFTTFNRLLTPPKFATHEGQKVIVSLCDTKLHSIHTVKSAVEISEKEAGDFVAKTAINNISEAEKALNFEELPDNIGTDSAWLAKYSHQHSELLSKLKATAQGLSQLARESCGQVLAVCNDAIKLMLLQIQQISKQWDSFDHEAPLTKNLDKFWAVSSFSDSLSTLRAKIVQIIHRASQYDQKTVLILRKIVFLVRYFSKILTLTAGAAKMVETRETSFFLCLAKMFLMVLQKGFVNQIPKMETGDGGQGKLSSEVLEGTGLGEGEGAKDVSEEIDDIGQVEGTQQDRENRPEDSQQQEDKTRPKDVDKPIDLDDDLGGDLEDLDLDKDDNSDSESEQEEGDEPDKEKGDVDEAQDEQELDPQLWGDEDQDRDKEMDDGAPGAEQAQDDLIAKEDEQRKDTQNLPKTDDNKPPETDQEGADQDEHVEKVDQRNEQVDDGQSEDEEAEPAMDELPADQQQDEQADENLDTDPEPDPSVDTTLDQEEPLEDMECQEDNLEPDKGDQEADKDRDEPDSNAVPAICGSGQAAQDPDSETNQSNMDSQPIEEDEQAANDDDRCNDANSRQRSTGQTGSGLEPARHHGAPDDVQDQPNAKKRKLNDEERTPADQLPSELSKPIRRRDLVSSQAPDSRKSNKDPETTDPDLWAHEPQTDQGPKPNSEVAWDETSLEQARPQGHENTPMEQDDGVEEITIEDSPTPVEEVEVTDESAPGQSKQHRAAAEKQQQPSTSDTGDADMASDQMPSGHGQLGSTVHTSLQFYERPSSLSTLETVTREMQRIEAANIASDQLGQKLWATAQAGTQTLAAELSENLRLTLEPTVASKLQGDYRSGKRLNIRKLIPFIASQFRKNKIWLRRTKKSKRTYQVLLAIDDSSSMADNKTHQLAMESIVLLSNALRFLQAGQLGVCSFGEHATLLHPLATEFTENAGAAVLSQLTFAQKKTNIAKLVEFTTAYLDQEYANIARAASSSALPAQLLLVVSDGRGIFAEGIEVVKKALRQAMQRNIFIVFVILDSPESRDSIADIRVPIFSPGSNTPVIKPYMEFFPFPFHVILRDINALPVIVGDALRQWFEVVGSAER